MSKGITLPESTVKTLPYAIVHYNVDMAIPQRRNRLRRTSLISGPILFSVVVLIALFAVRRMLLNKAKLQAPAADTLQVTSDFLLFNGDTIEMRQLDSIYSEEDTVRKLQVVFDQNAQWGRTLPVNDSLAALAKRNPKLIIRGLLE